MVADIDTPYSSLVAPMIVAGVGMGLVLAPTAAVVLGSVSKEHAGKASGANTTVREIGGALGIAVLSSVFVAHGGMGTPRRFIDGLHPGVGRRRGPPRGRGVRAGHPARGATGGGRRVTAGPRGAEVEARCPRGVPCAARR